MYFLLGVVTQLIQEGLVWGERQRQSSLLIQVSEYKHTVFILSLENLGGSIKESLFYSVLSKHIRTEKGNYEKIHEAILTSTILNITYVWSVRLLVLQLHLSLLQFTASAAGHQKCYLLRIKFTQEHDHMNQTEWKRIKKLLKFFSLDQSINQPTDCRSLPLLSERWKKCFVSVFQRITPYFSWCEFVCQCLTCEQRASEAW